MKKLVPAALIALTVLPALALSFTGHPSEGVPPEQIQGVWRIVHFKMITDGKVMADTDVPDDGHASLKLIGTTYFSFGAQVNDSTVFAGGGTYTFDGTTYTEVPLYHSVGSLVGKQIPFKITMDGPDRFLQAGNADEATYLEETYVRVK